MKIAIHHNKRGFSVRWINYCENNNIPYKIVNCYDSDIIKQLEDCDCLMWHHSHGDYRDVLFAKQLLYSLETGGKKVFPDFNTCWHFDDKVGQKYLFESINAPLVPSYVFYTKREALEWVETTTFPKVFKLRGGAGSANVKLAKTKQLSKKIVNKAFGMGFPQLDRINYLKESYRHWKMGTDKQGLLKGIYRLLFGSEFAQKKGREKGYVYFQDFMPDNEYDIRVVVIGNKAFAIKRIVRENDFRASGSGHIVYEKEEIPIQCVQIAFDISKKLKIQCIGYDFIYDKQKRPLIVEISYGFTANGYDPCPGYWTDDLIWHQEQFNPYGWMIENLIDSCRK
jgi:glutathione synthase/RimK-type ligase-like ATP-grasp enzyme